MHNYYKNIKLVFLIPGKILHVYTLISLLFKFVSLNKYYFSIEKKKGLNKVLDPII